jgi:hypothetical protein
MNRNQRRAAERLAHKAANKAASETLALDAVCQAAPPAPVAKPLVLRAPKNVQIAAVPEPGRPFPLLSEITPARLAANRENAQLSTGPKTAEGKSISGQNRTTHGLARHNGRFALLPTENSEDFAQLLSDLTNEHQPTTTTELALVQAMAESWWLRSRAQNLQPACFDPTTGVIINEKQLSLLLRYENSYTRTFNSSLNQLLKLRSEKRKADLGFEAQTISAEKHQMKKDAHYWDILKKDAETCYQLGRNVSDKMTNEAQLTDFTARFDAELAKYKLKGAFCTSAVAA